MQMHNALKRPEHFVLSDEFVEGIIGSRKGMHAMLDTLQVMHDLAIDKLPYPNVDITLSVTAWTALEGALSIDDSKKQLARYHDGFDRATATIYVRSIDGTIFFTTKGEATVAIEAANGYGNVRDMTDVYAMGAITDGLDVEKEKHRAQIIAMRAVAALVVGLAMKGARKERKEDRSAKLARFGIGKNKTRPPYTHTTTLTIAKDRIVDESGGHTGKHLVTHLRRGHDRDQRWGPGYQFVKKIFIEPVFVNGDPDYVPSMRDRYNVKGSKSAGERQLSQVKRETIAT